jgi:hypothetical protein
MNRVEIGCSYNDGALHDLQLDLIFRTQLEVDGTASLEMIEENNRLRADFIDAADRLGYSDSLGLCGLLRVGIPDRVTTNDLKELAYRKSDLNTSHFLVNAAKYFLERRISSDPSEGT